MILSPTIVPHTNSTVLVSWSGTAGATVRIWVSGILVFGPAAIATADRSIVVGVSAPFTIEVHENAADETVPIAGVPLERKPLVWWHGVAGAAQYRVYIDDVLRGVVKHDDWRPHHELRLATDVRRDGAAWRTLHVAAVDASGDEIESDDKPIFVPGVPLEPAAVTITGGSGVFAVTVTP